MKTNSPDNNYTQSVKRLIEQVCPADPSQPSVFQSATEYFASTPKLVSDIKQLQNDVSKEQAVRDKQGKLVVSEARTRLKAARNRLEDERLERLAQIDQVAYDLLALCEGDTYEETQLLSAKFLGTIMLITRGPVANFARFHQRLKPLYKAVLVLRLFDKAIEDGILVHPFLTEYSECLTRFRGNRYWQERWVEEVALPLIKAAILQDIGLQHPNALRILLGDENDKDEFRVLENDDRKALLKLNYQHTLDYLKFGIGTPRYVGNDKSERDQYQVLQTHIMSFMLDIVKDAFVPKSGSGELLKIPQIYASIVLSTKPDYSRKSLPKGYLLIEQLAKKGTLNEKLATGFISIVGYFPQGFGITYIPRNERGIEREQYECAIVTRLNPSHPAEPVCRSATRNLTYIASGSDETVRRSANLYFQGNRDKLMRIGKERLIEIMSQLSSNFNPEDVDELIPSYWEPSDYFSVKKNQNLWNKS